MVRIDAIYREDPTSDNRRIVLYLTRVGTPINREDVNNLMRCIGLRKIYQKTRATDQGSTSERIPCLMDLNEDTSIDQI
jgi:hypothetical protein